VKSSASCIEAANFLFRKRSESLSTRLVSDAPLY
jgi:hypothetical protein